MGEEGKRNGNAPALPSAVPKGFEVRDDGVYRHIPAKEGGTEAVKICSPLEVVAQARNDGRDWSRLIRFKDSDGRQHEMIVPMTVFAGDGTELRAMLLEQGLLIEPNATARSGLTAYLLASKPTARATLVKTTGWHESLFVLPERPAIGPKGAEPYILRDAPSDHALRTSGTVAQWQEDIGKPCRGNSRLIFAVSISVAAPLLYLTGDESAGFHFVGDSSLRKTTAQRVSVSVCGSPQYLSQWRQTANGLEAAAAGHNDLLLPLDEIGLIDAKTLGEVAYMLTGGRGKGRMNRDLTGRPTAKWRLLFLSSGEMTLADKIKEEGKRRATAGQAVRILDIPARAGAYGLFEDLHGSKDGQEFSVRLCTAAGMYYGTPLIRFLEKLAEPPSSSPSGLKRCAAVSETSLNSVPWTVRSCEHSGDSHLSPPQAS